MSSIISISGLSKTYDGGVRALDSVSLDIESGEILALLGPNGAGKTTLISTICGLSTPTAGMVTVGGYDTITDFRAARAQIGLVPQEVTIEPFETVLNTVRMSRGLFGKRRDDTYIEKILRDLSLWDKKNTKCMALSGGMKRRVMIAKALSHEPKVLFLGEPSAGVDVALRRDMWAMVRRLRDSGVTIILTTHYIEEAEEMADRIGVIDRGKLLLVQEKDQLMKQLGRKQLHLTLQSPVQDIPEALAAYGLTRDDDGATLIYSYDTHSERTGITRLIADMAETGLSVRDVISKQSSLEDVFLTLVEEGRQ